MRHKVLQTYRLRGVDSQNVLQLTFLNVTFVDVEYLQTQKILKKNNVKYFLPKY